MHGATGTISVHFIAWNVCSCVTKIRRKGLCVEVALFLRLVEKRKRSGVVFAELDEIIEMLVRDEC